MKCPKLRPIDAVAIRDGDRVYVQLYDPSRLSDKVLILPQELMFVLALLDGAHTVRDIQAALMRRFGELVSAEKIQEIVEHLDAALLLDGERFRAHLREAEQAFRDSPVRPPSSAGSAYPANPRKLAAELDGYFTTDGGPGRPSPGSGDGALVGLVAPHIDFQRGGPSYAHAYKALAEECSADLFMIFGTAHFSQGAPYILTTKSFQTPLGTLNADRGLVEALAKRCGRDLFAEELVHKNEHSIELQVVFLQHVLGGRAIEIVPVLCGSMAEQIGEADSPREVAEISDFLDALRDVVAESGRKACAIAGADLSHVGSQFGDEFPLSPQVMRDVERADRRMLSHVERLDADAFFADVHSDGNARHVCGAPPIYALLATTAARRARLLDYRQATDYDLQRAVTFAGLAFYK